MQPVESVNPFTSPLLAITSSDLVVAREKVANFPREELVNRFRQAFHAGKRATCLLYADGLIDRGIPPAFWHSHLSRTDYSEERRFDLLVYDVRWLRSMHTNHASDIRYTRYKLMLTGTEKDFWREVEYAFYAGRRPAWKIVGSFSLTQKQQTDCWWLRSAPVSRHLQSVTEKRDDVFAAIKEDMKRVRRTATFTDEAAKALVLRRHQIWLCGQMTDKKPTETALRFEQMIGKPLSRQLAARHLEKVDEALRKIEMATSLEIEMT